MEKQIIQAKDFLSRQDLIDYIVAEIGQNIQENRQAGHTIEGTREELKRFQLSDTNTIFGIKVVITDSPTKNLVKKKKK